MILPSRSALWKTLLLVVVAACCLYPKSEPKIVLPRTKSTATSTRTVTPSLVTAQDSAPEKSEVSNYQFATRWNEQNDPVLADFVKWTDRYIAAKSSDRPALLDEGISLAKQRRERVAKLIRTQPKLALAQTPPYSVRSQLPTEINAIVEQRVSGKGDFLVLGRTDSQGINSAARRVSIAGSNYDAFTYGARLAQRSARNVSLHGVALNGALALSDSPLRALDEGEPVPADKPLAAGSCVISGLPTAPTPRGPREGAVAAVSGDKVYWLCCGGHLRAASDGVTKGEGVTAADGTSAFGPHTILVMVVDFSDAPGAVVTSDAALGVLNDLNTFYQQCSYGDFSFSTKTVTPLLHLNRTRAYYGSDTQTGDSNLLDDARTASRAAGIDPNLYDLDVVTFANVGFGFRGQGYVGLKGAWIQGGSAFTGDVLGHELGHNLGVWHANSWTSSTIIGETGEHHEYGNLFDVMSNGSNFPLDHFNANFKYILGWLPARNVATATNSGVYRLYAQDQNSRTSDRTYGVRIPVGIFVGGESEDYWLELRQLLSGRYSATANGAVIQWGNDVGTQEANRLLDMTPGTADMSDAPLQVGQTFRDVDRGIEVTPLAKSGSGADAYIDLQINVTLPPVIPLEDALDTTNLSWTTSGSAWIGQHSVNHDAMDAAASGPTRENGQAVLETTVTGPGGISFWWKVSSEQDFDFLKFQIDGVEFASISGEVDWEQQSFEVNDGQHTLRWIYSKDQAESSGADRGWIDQVAFTLGARPPQINVQPAPMSVLVGDVAHVQVQAGGSSPLLYQWHFGADDIPGATNSLLVITNAQIAIAGQYSVTVSNTFGTATSASVLLTVIQSLDLSEALDFDAAWKTFGDVKWRGQNTTTMDGADAAQSGPITDAQSSSLTTTLTGPGNLSFWWKVSSEEKFDGLSFYVDADLTDKISGELDWLQKTLLIPNGAHVVRWTYAKDASLGKGADAGWVDQVTFTPISNLPPSITSQPASQSVSLGGTAIFHVNYAGSDPVTFQWFQNDKPLSARPGLTGANSAELTLSNIQSTDAGKYTVLIQNDFGQQTSGPATLTIVPLSLADAVDDSTHLWITGGAADTNIWTAVFAKTHVGVTNDVAMSRPIGNSTNAWIQTEFDGPATLSFWWKVSSETNYDTLTFQIDGLKASAISGEIDWQQQTYNLGDGRHQVRWIYAKDSNFSKGQDAGWLDDVHIANVPNGPQISSLALNAGYLAGTIDNLQGARYIIEASSDLLHWIPMATNTIVSPSANFTRAANNSAEFIRIKTE